MVDFGDELIMESNRLPWLIWIQLLITILLIVVLFFGLASFAFDASSSSSSAAAASCDAAVAARLYNSASSTGIAAVEGERARDGETRGRSIQEEEESVKDTAFLSVFRHPNHPCNYLGFAKNALFKCLGLDSSSSSESSSSEQHEKRD